MINFRSNLLQAVSEPSDNSLVLFDGKFDSPTMYDAASGATINLDSAGIYNTTYNCLQKRSGSGNRCNGAARMSLIRSLLKTYDISSFTQEHQFLIETYFLPISTARDDFWNGVGLGFDCNSSSWNYNYSTEWTTLRNYVQYGTTAVYKHIYRQIGTTSRTAEIWLNDQLLISRSTKGNITMLSNIISRAKSYSNLVIFPCPNSQSVGRNYYIKELKLSILNPTT